MANAYIQVAPDSSGKQVDNESLVVAGSTVYRQRVEVTGANANDIAVVTASGGLLVQPSGGVLSTVSVVTSLSSATVYQGTSPWLTQAATSGGNQPVAIAAGSTSSLQLVQHTTSGGAQPVAIAVGSTSSLQLVQHTTSGGSQPVSLTNALPLSVVASTTGGNSPVFLGNTLPLFVVASTTGGAAPVSAVLTPSTSAIQLVQAATSGGNAPVFIGNALPLLVVASTTGGAAPVSAVLTPSTSAIQLVQSVTSGGSAPVFLNNTLPLLVVASTTGGAAPVSAVLTPSTSALQLVQSVTSGGSAPVFLANTLPLLVVASTTGGAAPVSAVLTPSTSAIQLVQSVTSGGSVPVFLNNTLPLFVVASTTGGAAPVSAVLTPSTSAITLVQAATSGGPQPVSILVGSTSSLQLVQATTSGGPLPVSIVVGSTSSLQLIQAATSGGAQPTAWGTIAAVTTAWTSATASDSTLTINTAGYGTIVVGFARSGTITGGTLNFEVSEDNSNWHSVTCYLTDFNLYSATLGLNGVVAAAIVADVNGYSQFRLRLNPVIAGGTSCTANLRIAGIAGAQARNVQAAINTWLGSGAPTVGQKTTAGSLPVTMASDQPVLSIVASSTGGAQPVAQSSTPWVTVASTTGGSQPVSLTNTLPLSVVASTTGGSQTVAQGAPPWSVVSTTSQGSGGLVHGMVASGVAVSGNPVVAGRRAATANPTAVADGQAVNAMGDKVGRTVVVLGHVRDLVGIQTTNVASTAETIVVTAGGAGVFNDIANLCITNRTTTAPVFVTLKDTTSGGTTRAIYDLAANGGVVIPFQPAMPQSQSSSGWTVTLSVANTVDVNVVYLKNV